MQNEEPPKDKAKTAALTRRTFTALTLSATAAPAFAAASVEERDVTIAMADGPCDAAVFHPAGTGTWPACLIVPDALGLRPAFRDMARRLSAEGYVVLVPNPFFRTRKAPVLTGPFDFGNPDDRAKLVPLMSPITNEVKQKDGAAWIAWLDAQPQVNKAAPVGISGYCSGGPYTMFIAAAVPERVGAAGSFHGGNLVTDKHDSPHLLAPKIKAAYYFAVATNDDQRQPEAKDKLREAFQGKPVQVEVYQDCMHGWCVSDSKVYNQPGSERAFNELVKLYKTRLV